MHVSELDTPALVIDLDIMERNLRRVAEYCSSHALRLRPHTKTHKVPAVGRRQLDSGAAGLTVAKVGEAEVMLNANPPDLLVAYPVIGRSKLARLVQVAKKTKVTVALDSLSAARQLSEAAREAQVEVGVLAEVEAGLGRVGVSPGPELIDMLRAASFEHSDALVLMSGNDVTRALQATGRANYQAVFGSDQFQSLQNYRVGLERCASVGRIGRSADTGFGSGFLVPGKVLDNTLSERPVLVTNAHAISDVEAIRRDGALHPSEAIATFEAMDGGLATKQFNIADIVFTSPPEMLDVTVATLAQDLPLTAPIPLAAVLPVRGTPAKVRVIGHPAGRGLSFSVNDLLDHESPRVHYRTATEGGSSGSPVFNAEWKLIALHHSGGEGMKKLNQQGGTYQANEGIWIGAICEAMKLARH